MAYQVERRPSGLLVALDPLRMVSSVGGFLWNALFAPPRDVAHTAAPAIERAYSVRKKQLPVHFSARDWERALEYWGYCCAVCERPRGLWHTLAQDHWVPLTAAECPGTLPSNILPLCHGEDGCNNSKGKKDPYTWLKTKLGTRRANRKLAEINAYFAWIGQQPALTAPSMAVEHCPACEGVLRWHNQDEGFWRCTDCGSEWVDE